jgi:PAS domain S-box-containing protein
MSHSIRHPDAPRRPRIRSLCASLACIRDASGVTEVLSRLARGACEVSGSACAAALLSFADGALVVERFPPGPGPAAGLARQLLEALACESIRERAGPRILTARDLPGPICSFLPGDGVAIAVDVSPGGGTRGAIVVARPVGGGPDPDEGVLDDLAALAITGELVLERHRLLSSEALLTTALGHSTASLVITDTNARILYVNRAFERVTGHTAEAVIGHRTSILKSGKHPRAFYERMWEVLRAGNCWQGDMVNRRRDGELYEAELNIAPVKDPSGRITHYVGCHRDVSREKQTQRRLKEKMRELDDLNRELDDFVARVSTLLREPLRAIEAQAAMLGRGDGGITATDSVRRAEMVVAAARTLRRRIHELLKLSRVGKGRRVLTRVSLDDVVREAMRELAFAIRQKRANVQVGPLPAVLGDRVFLVELWTALLANAVQYSANRAPAVTIQVSPCPDTPPGFVRLVTRDTGAGIPERDLDRVFRPFFRGRDAPGDGAGMGLAIARRVVERHGGRIWAESSPGSGSSFYVTLPESMPHTTVAAAASSGDRLRRVVDTADADAGAAGPSERVRSEGGDRAVGLHPVPDPTRFLKVLVVENDPLVADIVSDALTAAAEFERSVDVVCDADEALRRLQEIRFDLVVLERDLPATGGIDLLDRIRKDRPAVPVLVTTGTGDERVAVEAIQKGAADYIPHEDLAAVLPRVVETVVARMQSGRALEILKTDMIGIVSHDLKNPVANVLGYADLLLAPGSHPPLPAPLERAAQRIRKNCEFMLDLISDILDTVRIDAGRIKLVTDRHELGSLVKECVERNAFLCADKGITLATDAPPAPVHATLDRGKILQVLNNLISNALKFSAAGMTVTVALRSRPGSVELSVADQGQGIAPGELDRLFKKFSKTSARPTGGEKGTGLGLYIVNEIVKLHGGEVSVASAPGRGACFTVRLPREDGEAAATREPLAS